MDPMFLKVMPEDLAVIRATSSLAKRTREVLGQLEASELTLTQLKISFQKLKSMKLSKA
jgi:hypothetical protein